MYLDPDPDPEPLRIFKSTLAAPISTSDLARLFYRLHMSSRFLRRGPPYRRHSICYSLRPSSDARRLRDYSTACICLPVFLDVDRRTAGTPSATPSGPHPMRDGCDIMQPAERFTWAYLPIVIQMHVNLRTAGTPSAIPSGPHPMRDGRDIMQRPNVSPGLICPSRNLCSDSRLRLQIISRVRGMRITHRFHLSFHPIARFLPLPYMSLLSYLL
ncbi:hypothetical protein FPV67DRAFT_1682582 [Lyophyllum atratum]|nr:hypothetical protein FPV67DRAFT_1683442 [Lyophyllum atratum]KAF8054500.1 hypothetical protein FPV67DRAFT_1682582 [Lyophyllum atratum]